MQVLYNTKVRFFILAAGRRKFGDKVGDALGRALAYLSADWKRLLIRMRKRGLSPKQAACVASAWIRNKAPADRLGFPIETAMDHVHDLLLFELTESEGMRGYIAIEEALSTEGLALDDEELS